MKKRLNIFLLAFPLCPVFQIQAQEKPNLVFIMADQWRGDALGCLGKEPVKTPCLDQLAREGVNFTNAVSSYPVSSPARGMLMTGMQAGSCFMNRYSTATHRSRSPCCAIPNEIKSPR